MYRRLMKWRGARGWGTRVAAVFLFHGYLLALNAAALPSQQRPLTLPIDFHPIHVASIGGDSVVFIARAADFAVLYSMSGGQSYIPTPPGFNATGIVTRESGHWLVDCCGQPAMNLFIPGLSDGSLRAGRGMIVGLAQWRGRLFASQLIQDSLVVAELGVPRGHSAASIVLPIAGTAGVLLWADNTGVYAIQRRAPFRVWIVAGDSSVGQSFVPELAKLTDAGSVVIDVFHSQGIVHTVVGDPKTPQRTLISWCVRSDFKPFKSQLASFALLFVGSKISNAISEYSPVEQRINRQLQLPSNRCGLT